MNSSLTWKNVAFLQTSVVHSPKTVCLYPSFSSYLTFPHFRDRNRNQLSEYSWVNLNQVNGPEKHTLGQLSLQEHVSFSVFWVSKPFPASQSLSRAGQYSSKGKKTNKQIPDVENLKGLILHFHFSRKLLTASVRRRSRWPLTPLKKRCPFWKRCTSLTSSLGREWWV